MSKCLFCYQELAEGQVDFHPSCARKFFGSEIAPLLPYTRDNMSELARQVIRTSASVTGVQAKMSLDVNRGGKNEPSKFTIVGLWGKYIFKPQSSTYPHLPELEDLTMKMAEAAHIRTARHTLIRLADGELGYLTLRMDRGKKGMKISMLDMCQLTNRLTEHKYYGTYPQLAETVKKYSSAPMLDVQRFWEVVLFSWMTGNSDMHCKNFSLIDIGQGEYVLSPAYDLLAVLLADSADTEEMAMSFAVGGEKSGFDRNTFMTAFTQSGIPDVLAEKMIKRMIANLPQWKELINLSFLPEKMKKDYCSLLDERERALNKAE
jgi:serine/threonine-protein kinase HipA